MGPWGGYLYALCVAIVCFGSITGITFTTSRLVFSAAKQHHLPIVFASLHPILGTPVRALLLHSALASLMLLIGTLDGLILFDGIIEFSWYLVLPS